MSNNRPITYDPEMLTDEELYKFCLYDFSKDPTIEYCPHSCVEDLIDRVCFDASVKRAYDYLKEKSDRSHLGKVTSVIVSYLKSLSSDEERLYELQQWIFRLIDTLRYPNLFSQIINTLTPEAGLKLICNDRWFWIAPDGKEVRTEYANRNLVTFALQNNLNDKIPELFRSVLADAKIEKIIEFVFDGWILWNTFSEQEEYTKTIISLFSIDQKRAYLEYRDKDNWNALHYAFNGVYLSPIADFIIKLYEEVYGNKTALLAALEQPDNKGETPLDIAYRTDSKLKLALSLYTDENKLRAVKMRLADRHTTNMSSRMFKPATENYSSGNEAPLEFNRCKKNKSI